MGRDGRPPPIRCIVKDFGPTYEDLRTRGVRRLLRDVLQLHQLGIFFLDMDHRQLVSGKLSDFSQAMTVPHYVTTPELNPRIMPDWAPALEFETFQWCCKDYHRFDAMVKEWNEQHEGRKSKVLVQAFPAGHGSRSRYDLRSTPSRERIYTLVDPRLYDWRNNVASPENGASGVLDGEEPGPTIKGSSPKKPRRVIQRPADGSMLSHPGGTLSAVKRWRRV